MTDHIIIRCDGQPDIKHDLASVIILRAHDEPREILAMKEVDRLLSALDVAEAQRVAAWALSKFNR